MIMPIVAFADDTCLTQAYKIMQGKASELFGEGIAISVGISS